MKNILPLILFMHISIFLCAQKTPARDTIVPAKGNPEKQLKQIKDDKKENFKDSASGQPTKSQVIDTTINNKYGDLLNDDKLFNKKYSLKRPIAQVIGFNIALLGFDRYVL